MKPKWIEDTKLCQWCGDEMNLLSFGLNKDESAVEVWYSCNCHKMGFAFANGFVSSFKEAMIKKETQREESPDTPTFYDSLGKL